MELKARAPLVAAASWEAGLTAKSLTGTLGSFPYIAAKAHLPLAAFVHFSLDPKPRLSV